MKYLSRVAAIGCILCRRLGYYGTPASIHHIRDGQGMGQRAKDAEAIPLCWEHHQGATGYHGLGKRAFEAQYGLTERDLLEDVRRELGKS